MINNGVSLIVFLKKNLRFYLPYRLSIRVSRLFLNVQRQSKQIGASRVIC